jgi:hypothetical protein
MSPDRFQNRKQEALDSHPLHRSTLRRMVGVASIALLVSLAWPVQHSWAQDAASGQSPAAGLKQLSLEELGNVEVTTVSKDPQEIMKTPAAVFVITQEPFAGMTAGSGGKHAKPSSRCR